MSDLREHDALELLDALGILKAQEPMRKQIADEIASLRAKAFKYLQECGKQAVRADSAEAQLAECRNQLVKAQKALEEIQKRDRMWTAFPGPHEILYRTDFGNFLIRGECGLIAHTALTDEQRGG